MKRGSLFYAVLLMLCFSNLQAQWKQIMAPGLNGYFGQGFGGAMEYKAGKLWVGLSKEVWVSPDDGATWTKSMTLGVGEIVYEISFFDGLHGLVCGGGSDLYMTTDGGISWNTVKTHGGGSTHSAKFINSATDIVVTYDISMTQTNRLVSVSRDGGITWNNNYVPPGGGFIEQVQVTPANELYVMQLLPNSGSRMHLSIDYGVSWTITSGRFDNDCNSFAIDACLPGQLYVINEESLVPDDNRTNIFSTTDNAATWNRIILKPFLKYGAGSLICTDRSILFAQTLDNINQSVSDGVIRSTDGGLTWMSINGPNGFPDSRTVVAKNNNVLYVAAEDGSIWMTSNCGGFPLPNDGGGANTLSFSSDSLFVQDSLIPCASISKERTLHLFIGGCFLPTIDKQEIIGTNASDFSIISLPSTPLRGNDSVTISFTASGLGVREATFELTLKDGRKFTIILQGVGIAPRPLQLQSVISIPIDTIGQEIEVPISIFGLLKAEDARLTMFYDQINLEYLGTTSVNGLPLDIPGAGSPGIAKLSIPKSEINISGITANAAFRVFGDSAAASKVRFDELILTDSTISCTYAFDTRTTTDIIIPSGCGSPTISYFVRHHKIPGFTILPNPSTGIITIAAINTDEATIAIVDRLGRLHGEFSSDFSKQATTMLDLHHLPSGLYFVRIQTSVSQTAVPVVIEK